MIVNFKTFIKANASYIVAILLKNKKSQIQTTYHMICE